MFVGWGGGSSKFFQSKLKLSEIPGGPTYVIGGGGGGGGGRQTFFQGGGVQLLSNRTYDFTRSRSTQLSRILMDYSDSLFSCLFSSFIMYPPTAAFQNFYRLRFLS